MGILWLLLFHVGTMSVFGRLAHHFIYCNFSLLTTKILFQEHNYGLVHS